MPVYKITYIFASGRNGWSETWYTTANDVETAEARALNVANRRVPLLGFQNFLEAIRISDEAIKFDAKLIYQGFQTHGPEQLTFDRDVVWTAALLSVTAGPIYKRSFLCRGLPDVPLSLNADKTRMQPGHQWLTQAMSFRQSLVQNQFALKVLDRSAANPEFPITQVSSSVLNRFTFRIPGINMVDGDRFHVYNLPKTFIRTKNIFEVFIVNDDSQYDTYEPFQTPSPLYLGGATARKRVILYPQIDGLSFARIVKRDTGRRFFVTRGRR